MVTILMFLFGFIAQWVAWLTLSGVVVDVLKSITSNPGDEAVVVATLGLLVIEPWVLLKLLHKVRFLQKAKDLRALAVGVFVAAGMQSLAILWIAFSV